MKRRIRIYHEHDDNDDDDGGKYEYVAAHWRTGRASDREFIKSVCKHASCKRDG